MKTKNIDAAIKAAELLEKGKCVYIHPGGSDENLEPVIVSEFPILLVEKDYLVLTDCYETVKLVMKSAYRGHWPSGNTKILPSLSQIDLIGKNIERVRNYIKLPKNYWEGGSSNFWIKTSRKLPSHGDHFAALGFSNSMVASNDQENCWILEVIP